MVDQAVEERVLRQIKTEQTVKLASDLISMPSFKTEEQKVARFLAGFFRRRGYEVDLQEVEPGRYQTIATLKGSGGGKSLMLNGHIDIDPLAMGWIREPFTSQLGRGPAVRCGDQQHEGRRDGDHHCCRGYSEGQSPDEGRPGCGLCCGGAAGREWGRSTP